jgi:hypothetical protein
LEEAQDGDFKLDVVASGEVREQDCLLGLPNLAGIASIALALR